ncbi:MAG: 3-deoxy-manno-octulosonate cytidylyltransferase [Fuerstiella sp.]
MNSKTIGVIPARLASSRLPRKLLLDSTGKPLIQYVWEIAKRCAELDDVIVATDSEEIADVVAAFGGRAEMTGEHPSGTDRVAEVVRRCCADADIIVNLQGDEPELECGTISALVQALKNTTAEMATVAAVMTDSEDVVSPDCVKVVVNDLGQAMYFSRSPIPFCRDESVADTLEAHSESPWKLHVGLYAYQRDFLLKLTEMPTSSLEDLEKLEQLRALQAGATIQVATVAEAAVGIDTPGDYAAFVSRQMK